MNSVRRASGPILAVFVAVALTLALVAPAALAATVVRVGYIPIGDCLQLYVAQDMGFFAEEGLTVEKKPMKGGAVIAPAVEAGEAEIGWSNAISIIIAHTKGFDFGFITSGALGVEPDNNVHSLLVAANSDITDIAGLKGKTVAINTLGNINDLAVIAMADAKGVNPKDIKLVEVPFPDMETALKNGSVQAILAVEPFVTLNLSHGTAKYLVKSAHNCFGDRYMIGSWFAKKSWVDANPDVAAAYARAINKASDYIKSNPDKVPTILVNNTKLTADLIAKIALPAFDRTFAASDLQPLVDVSAKYKFVPAAFPASDVIFSVAK